MTTDRLITITCAHCGMPTDSPDDECFDCSPTVEIVYPKAFIRQTIPDDDPEAA